MPKDALLKLKELVQALPKDVNGQKIKLLELNKDKKEELYML